jgi:two-component system, sensor histidine kinase LadS
MFWLKRMVCVVLCGCLLQALAWAQVSAQTSTLAAALSAKQAIAAVPAVTMQISVHQNGLSPADITAAQIAVSAESNFSPFNLKTVFRLGPHKPVWLRLRISSAQNLPANAWLVNFSKPFVDTVTLHTAQADGTWQAQSAGDWLAHSTWPIRSAKPQFWVPARASGSQDVFLEVRNRTPMYFELNLLSAMQAREAAQSEFLLIGLALGLMLLMTAISGVLAVTYRQAVYAWYGLFVATNMLVSASYTGLAAYALWPDASSWPELSITLFYMLGVVLQLQFCRAMFLSGTRLGWIHRAVLSTMALGLLAIPLNFYVIQNWGSSLVFSLQVFILAAASLGLMVSQFKRGYIVSWLCLFSSMPLMVVGGMSVLESSGWIVFSWLPYNAPIYAFALEMPLLFAALYLHAKAEHAKTVRKLTLASTDPSTGFVHSSLHMETLTKMWLEAKAAGLDLVVAYVEVSHQRSHVAQHGTPNRDRSTERAVRLLRTVAHERDTVAHVDTNLFAILMPHISLGDDVTNRLARLVALAAMTDQDAATDAPIRFHIAASSVRSFDGAAKKLHAALQHKLKQTDWGQRAIRYVRMRSVGQQTSGSSQPEETLSEFWQRAVEDDKKLSTVPASLAS